MFGKNPILKRIEGDGTYLSVHEIFYTIQGEGPFAGYPAVFVRLFGCHLKCTWCDTDFSNDNVMNIVDILDEVRQYGPPWLVVLTGGEPTRQPIDSLVRMLTVDGYAVQIETAGSFFRECMAWPQVFTIVSPKTSFVDKRVAEYATAYKYVINADMQLDDDGLPITDTQGTGHFKALAKPPSDTIPVYINPMDEYSAPKNASNLRKAAEIVMRYNDYGLRMGVQIHKLVDLP